MVNDCAGLRLLAHLYCNDAVIELLWRRPRGANIIRIARVNADWISVNAYNLKHRAHEVRFVLAVTIRLRKNLVRSVWTITAATTDSGLNRNVLDVLYVSGDSGDLFEFGFGEGR